MKRIAQRDEAALEALYDRYCGAVYAIARQILAQPADAEEVVDDTFWEVWRKADRYDPTRGSVASYLLLLARSRAIDRSRQVRAQRPPNGSTELLDDQTEPKHGESNGEPDADLLLTERRAMVRRLLAELTPEQRQAIELNFLKGLSHQQVSEALEVPLGTIKTRIRQGLIQLFDRIRTNDEDREYEL